MELFFLISFLECSLLVYNNVADFCALIFYAVNVLNFFISYNRIFVCGRRVVESVGFSTGRVMLSVDRENFTSSFPIWIPFISFSCLIVLARTPGTMLNTVVKVDTLAFFLILEGSFESFTTEYEVSCGVIVLLTSVEHLLDAPMLTGPFLMLLT